MGACTAGSLYLLSKIFICAKVFLTDKKKLREFGGTEMFNRIKKELAKEVCTNGILVLFEKRKESSITGIITDNGHPR